MVEQSIEYIGELDLGAPTLNTRRRVNVNQIPQEFNGPILWKADSPRAAKSF